MSDDGDAQEPPKAVTAAMNAAAQPFVPKEDDSSKGSPPKGVPAQHITDKEGVEVDTGGMSGVSIWRPQYKGRIRSFSEQKGFGFIECADALRAFGRDVFIHRFQMAEFEITVGQEVIFEVELNKNGQPQGRRVRPNEEVEEAPAWDMSMMGGGSYDNSWGNQYGGAGGGMYGGGMGGGGMGGGMGGSMGGANYYHQGRERYGAPSGDHSTMMGMSGDQGPPEAIEEMLRSCSGSSDMWEIIEQYGHSFGKKHVVTALYQLGLCRQYEKRAAEVNLTSALVDRLVLFSPTELSADEASRVLWALAVLDEVSGHTQAHRFAMELGEQAAKRFNEFTPAQMAGFVSSLSRLVRDPSEDELVGKITTEFSDYALGGTGALPRFAPHELTTWTNFLKEAASKQAGPGHGGGPSSPYPFMPGMPGKGGGAYGQPGSYSGGPGMMPPQWMGGMDKGMSSMPPMGKGGGGGGAYPTGKMGGKDPYNPGPMDGKGMYGGKPGPGAFPGLGGMHAKGPPGGGYGMPEAPGGFSGGGFGGGFGGPGPSKGRGLDMGANLLGPGGKPGTKGMGAHPSQGGKGPGDMPGGFTKGGPMPGPGPMGRPGMGGFGGMMGGPPPGQPQQRGPPGGPGQRGGDMDGPGGPGGPRPGGMARMPPPQAQGRGQEPP